MIIGPCTVVTGGSRPRVVEDAAVRVVGTHIAHVGPAGALAMAFPQEPLWPARGRVLMPGLVNSHTHLARHLARGLGLRPRDWSRYDAALSAEDVQWAAAAALVEGARHGVTTVCDFHRSSSCLELSLSEVAGAASSVGVRLAACYGASEDDPVEKREAALSESLSFALDLRRRRSGKLGAMLGLRARTLAGVERLIGDAVNRMAEPVTLHVELALDSTPAEPWCGRLAASGGPAALWAHADLAPRALRGAARDRGDALAATEIGPLDVLARESEVAWGSDTGLNAAPLGDARGGWRTPSRSWSDDLFVAGARWAARPFGEELGSIAPGAPADLVLRDYYPASELSDRTLGEHLSAGLLRAPVAGVMVAGDVILDRGAWVTVDEARIAARARECAARVWKRL